jgi:hypothetical protein
MEIIKNEQKVKNPSLFLKVNDKSKIVIKSHLIRLFTVWIENDRKTILWSEEIDKSDRRQEFYYWAIVDGDEGVLRLPASIFFTMNENERLMEKDKRDFEWSISKTGSGLKTKYEAVRGKEIKVNLKEIDENTEKLKNILTKYEARLRESMKEYLNNKEELDEPNGDEDVNSEEIPF